MSQALGLPQGRIPLGWVNVGGQRLPVDIDPEWLRALTILVNRSGGVAGNAEFGNDVFASSESGSSNQAESAETTTQPASELLVVFPDITQPSSSDVQDKVIVRAGTAAAPSITTVGNTATGIFFPSANTIGISINGVEKFRVDSSGHITTEGVTATGATGTGKLVFDTSPTLVNPNLGTPSFLDGTNITGTASSLDVGHAATAAVAAGLYPGSGVSGTKTPPVSLTVSNGIVTAWT